MHVLLHVRPVIMLPEGIVYPSRPEVFCQIWVVRVVQQSCSSPFWCPSLNSPIHQSLATMHTFLLKNHDGSMVKIFFKFLLWVSHSCHCNKSALLEIGTLMCIAVYTTGKLFGCFFVFSKWECYRPAGRLLCASIWIIAALYLQLDGTYLVFVPPWNQTSVDGGATWQGVLLTPSDPVSISALHGLFVFRNKNPLDTVSAWGVTKRRPGIPCVLYDIIAPHCIVNATSGRLATVSVVYSPLASGRAKNGGLKRQLFRPYTALCSWLLRTRCESSSFFSFLFEGAAISANPGTKRL